MTDKLFHLATNSGRTPDDPDGTVPTKDQHPDGQFKDHWVLPAEERAKGFVRPVRRQYQHLACGACTSMPLAIAETYAREPHFYGSTFCCTCRGYFPVGADGQFVWVDERGRTTNERVGT